MPQTHVINGRFGAASDPYPRTSTGRRSTVSSKCRAAAMSSAERSSAEYPAARTTTKRSCEANLEPRSNFAFPPRPWRQSSALARRKTPANSMAIGRSASASACMVFPRGRGNAPR